MRVFFVFHGPNTPKKANGQNWELKMPNSWISLPEAIFLPSAAFLAFIKKNTLPDKELFNIQFKETTDVLGPNEP